MIKQGQLHIRSNIRGRASRAIGQVVKLAVGNMSPEQLAATTLKMRGRARWEEPLFKEAAISYVQSLLPGPEKKAVRTIADVKLTHSDAAFICLTVTNQLMKASGQEEEQADGAADGEDEGDEEGCGLETTDAVAKSTQVHNTNRKAWARLLVLAEEYGGERGKGAAGSFALLDDDEAAAKCVACVTPGAHTKDVAKKVREALGFKQRV